MQIRRFIRRPEVLNKTGLSATTIYNLENRGEFPMHFMITPRCAAWDEIQVDEWLAARKASPAKPSPAPVSPNRLKEICTPGPSDKACSRARPSQTAVKAR